MRFRSSQHLNSFLLSIKGNEKWICYCLFLALTKIYSIYVNVKYNRSRKPYKRLTPCKCSQFSFDKMSFSPFQKHMLWHIYSEPPSHLVVAVLSRQVSLLHLRQKITFLYVMNNIFKSLAALGAEVKVSDHLTVLSYFSASDCLPQPGSGFCPRLYPQRLCK